MDVSCSTLVDAPPERVWDLVTDLPGMGALSPEATGGTWLDGATGPAVGARFKGTSRNGWHRWSTVSKILAYEPSRVFTFDVKVGPMDGAVWTYRLEPEAGGTRVTEEWTDTRGWLLTQIGKVGTGVSNRTEHNARGMEQTLAALKQAAELG